MQMFKHIEVTRWKDGFRPVLSRDRSSLASPKINYNRENRMTTLNQTDSLTGNEEFEIVNNTSSQNYVNVLAIKNYILKDLKINLGIPLVENTQDVNKPLSLAQKVYIDSLFNNVNNRLTALETALNAYLQSQSN